MATLIVFGLEDSVIGFWVIEVIVESVLVVSDVEVLVVVVVEVEAIGNSVWFACNLKVKAEFK